MSELNKKYQDIINELESAVDDKEKLTSLKTKITDLLMCVTDLIYRTSRLEEDVVRIDRNLRRAKRRIDEIEEDIYVDSDDYDEEFEHLESVGSDQMHDNDVEFEILCPYCEYEFITDSSYKNEKSIKCPKCNKIIELDWSSEDTLDDEDDYEEFNSDKSQSVTAESNEDYSIDIKQADNDGNTNNKKDDGNNINEDEDDM